MTTLATLCLAASAVLAAASAGTSPGAGGTRPSEEPSRGVAGGNAPVAIESLAEPSFRPFGQVIEVPAGTPPTGENAVMKCWGAVARARFHEEVEFGVLRVRARDRELAEMERHQRSPVFLVALDGDFHLPVAPYSVSKGGKTRPEAARVKVFLVRRGQGVLLRRGAWHALPFPVQGEGLFIEAVREGTGKKDTVLRPFRGGETVKF